MADNQNNPSGGNSTMPGLNGGPRKMPQMPGRMPGAMGNMVGKRGPALNMSRGLAGRTGAIPRAGMGGAANNASGENEDGSQQAPQTVKQQATETAKEVAKEQAKKQAKKIALKVIPPILPYVGIALVVLLSIYFLVVAPMLYISVKIEEIKAKVIETGNKIVNLFAGDGFLTSADAVAEKLKKAEDAYENDRNLKHEGEFDSDILIATLQHDTFVSPSVYEDTEEESKEDEYIEDDQEANFKFVDSGQSYSYYNVQLGFLGQADLKNHPGENRLIFQLVGYKISWTCTTGTLNSIGAYIDAAADALDASLNHQTANPADFADLLPHLVRTIRDMISFKQEGKDYWEYIKSQDYYENFSTEQKSIFLQLFQDEIPSCSPIIEGESTQERVATPYVTMYMDYHNYFKYLSEVYIPTNAFECKKCPKDLSDEEKKAYIRQEIEGIVDDRNALNSQKETVNLLTVTFDVDGNFSTAVSSVEGVSGYIPVGTAGTGWKQIDERWKSLELVDGDDSTTMGRIGCYITSIAIIMANSGTPINSDYFDPSVLAKTLKRNGGIDDGGGVSSHAWGDLAPSFGYSHWLNYNNFEQFNRELAEKINQGYYAIIHVYKDSEGKGHHFVAVVGIENGHIIISDPGYRGPDGQPIGDRLFTLEDYQYAIRGPIVSGRIFKDSSKGG